jgi:hypothetical protein
VARRRRRAEERHPQVKYFKKPSYDPWQERLAGSNDVHFEGIIEKKGFANAKHARDGGYRINKGCKSKKTGIQSWRLEKSMRCP